MSAIDDVEANLTEAALRSLAPKLAEIRAELEARKEGPELTRLNDDVWGRVFETQFAFAALNNHTANLCESIHQLGMHWAGLLDEMLAHVERQVGCPCGGLEERKAEQPTRQTMAV